MDGEQDKHTVRKKTVEKGNPQRIPTAEIRPRFDRILEKEKAAEEDLLCLGSVEGSDWGIQPGGESERAAKDAESRSLRVEHAARLAAVAI